LREVTAVTMRQRELTMKRLQAGDTVQDFTLPSSTGRPVTLSDVLQGGPVVLAWYLFDFGRV
jgi:peroxiredoxin